MKYIADSAVRKYGVNPIIDKHQHMHFFKFNTVLL